MVEKNNKRLKANLKIRMFLVFLVLSLLFWTLIKLSKAYTTDVVFDVNYKNIPANKVFQSSVISEITASVKSSGFNLLKYKINRKKLNIDLSGFSYKSGLTYYYLPNNHLSELRFQLTVDSSIERISIDTIFVSLGQNKVKKVPVELNAEIQFKLGYNFVGEILMQPDSVLVSGPASLIDTIYKVVTHEISLKEVSGNIERNVSIHSFNNENVILSNSQVELFAEIDRFTEGTLNVTFEVINIPDDVKIITFPKEVAVIYKVGLSNFSKITTENMKVVCDFKQTEEHNQDYMIPALLEQSSLISSVRFVPAKIEFLIEKR